MNTTNLKNLKSEKGFTIVELLIVIVVIGILAAIVIVAYNGVQNRAKTSKSQAAASAVIKKLETYVADGPTGTYPTTFGTLTASANSDKTYYVTGVTFTATLLAAAPGSGSEATVTYSTCATPAGARVTYWDYSLATPAVAHLYTGAATSSSSCSVVGS